MTAVYDDVLGALVGGGRYRVVRRLGAGAFGQVFEARQEAFGLPLRSVALKLFTASYVTRDNAAKVFQEALMLAELAERAHGPEANHLVAVLDAGMLADYRHVPYVAMELVAGGSLAGQLRQARRLPLPAVVRLLRQVCTGLTLAHQARIVHRDLKPDNVLLAADGTVKVADFGVAIDRFRAFLEGGATGTITYAPPESRQGDAPTSPAWDVYSLGVMALELLTGENPLEGVLVRARAQQLDPDRELLTAQTRLARLEDPLTGRPLADHHGEVALSSRLQALLARCLAWAPDSRFPEAAELDRALAGLEPGAAAPAPPASETADQQRRRLLLVAEEHLRFGEREPARAALAALAGLDPGDAAFAAELSRLHEQAGETAAAVRWQEAAGRRAEPGRADLERLARLYEQVGRGREAGLLRLRLATAAGRGAR